MRTIVEIGAEQVAMLDALAAREGKSRTALIREAVQELLARRPPQGSFEDTLAASFGIWRTEGDEDTFEDGLAYQRRLRSEWPD